MKNLLMVSLVFAGSTLSAQLKLYTTGNISVGSILQPPSNVEFQVVGNTLFSQSSAASTSSAYIKGANIFSTDSLPDYCWWGDSLTGMFHPALQVIAFTNAGNEAMRLSSAANLLIGSQSDNGDRLQVTAGLNKNPLDIYANFNSSSGYSGINWLNDTSTKAWAVKYNGQDKFYVYGDGQAYAYGWNTMSDSSLKVNIRPIQNALQKVLKLEGVMYNLKLNGATASTGQVYASSEKMGLIAQAVERVVPEVVSAAGDGKKTVAYGNMVGLLVEALKQEDAKVDALQHKLDSVVFAKGKNQDNSGSVGEGMDDPKEAKLYPCKTCLAKDSVVIGCYIPDYSKDASLLIFDINGKLQKNISISGKETQYVSLNKINLSTGMYYYTLVVNGNEINTRKMIITD